MERFLLYLDDLEDLIYALVLTGERIRRIALLGGALLVSVAGQCAAVLVALRQPALGLAVAALLAVAVLYRSVTRHIPLPSRPAAG